MGICPGCGHCRECGRRCRPPSYPWHVPYYPPYPYYEPWRGPYYPYPERYAPPRPAWTCKTATNTAVDGNVW